MLPLLTIYAANGLCHFFKTDFMSTFHGWQKIIAIFLLINNILPALYFGLEHQAGTVSVMQFIREESDGDRDISVTFLMPCHSTPYYRLVFDTHRDICAQMLQVISDILP